jgi:hypothetical protein
MVQPKAERRWVLDEAKKKRDFATPAATTSSAARHQIVLGFVQQAYVAPPHSCVVLSSSQCGYHQVQGATPVSHLCRHCGVHGKKQSSTQDSRQHKNDRSEYTVHFSIRRSYCSVHTGVLPDTNMFDLTACCPFSKLQTVSDPVSSINPTVIHCNRSRQAYTHHPHRYLQRELGFHRRT